MLNKNYGFIEPKIKETDYFFGSKKLGSKIINPSGNWLKYLPVFEHQRKKIETNACVSFGTLSALEMIHQLLWKVEPNYSDRYLAKMSKTDPNSGNTPERVSEALKDYGTVPEADWGFTEPYYEEIPDDIKEIGKEWTKNYGYGWEWTKTEDLKEALKRSPVCVAVSAWQKNSNGEYEYFGNWNHWCVCVGFDEQDRPIVFDSYEENLKTLAKDHKLGFPQIYMLDREKKEVKQSWWEIIINFIKRLWQK